MSHSTIEDVARLAGVSAATVSHVINGTRFVSPQTKKAVLDAIDALSYIPNRSARNLKTGKNNTIGFITPTLTNSYFFNIIEQVESMIRKAGYSLLISNSMENVEKEIQSLRYMSSGFVDGIISISAIQNFNDIANIIPKKLPIILIDRVLDNYMCDTIEVSTYDSFYEATLSLLDSGRHTKIGYLGSNDNLKTTMERFSGFQDALTLKCWDSNKVCIRTADSTADAQEIGTAYSNIEEMIAHGVTAILVSTNLMTQEALRYFSNHNISPQKDIELIGLFNPPYICPFSEMKWINMPGKTLGTMAGKMILERLDNPDKPYEHQILKSKIITN